MSTPYLDEAERCSRIVLLHEGRVLALDEPGALRASLPGTMLEVLVPSPRDSAASGCEDPAGWRTCRCSAIDCTCGSITTTRPGQRRRFVKPPRARRSDATGVRAIVPSLEDVFIAKLSESQEASAP